MTFLLVLRRVWKEWHVMHFCFDITYLHNVLLTTQFRYLSLSVTDVTFFICRLTMAVVCTGICVVFFVNVLRTRGETAECKSYDVQLKLEGRNCHAAQSAIGTISVIERHHCTLACFRSKDCRATVYDSRHSVCTLFPQPCMLLRPRPNHVYRSFVQPCFKWISTCSKCNSNYWMIEFDNVKTYIARMYHNEDLLVGKLTNKFYAITLNGQTNTSLHGYEELVVDPSCNATWIWFNANSEQLLPECALIGGFAAVTQTPLYVSRLDISGRHVVGYYNPLNSLAWGHWEKAVSRTTFEVLVIHPSYVIV